MELLRRALLVGCVLPGLWLLRLAPLEPLLTIIPVDFAARQAAEAAAVPDHLKTEAQRRAAELPFPVYVEEVLEYNVYPATGPSWDRLLASVDQAAGSGTGPTRNEPRPLFVRRDQEPVWEVLGKLAGGKGTTHVSFSRADGDHHYRVAQHAYGRNDFRLGQGFVGAPAPPASLLYPFRAVGLAAITVGVALFALLPGRTGRGGRSRLAESGALGAGLLLFAAPLVLVGGSVQAFTRGAFLTLPCWALAAVAVHLFARPWRNASLLPSARQSEGSRSPAWSALFVREGLAFLLLAVGPLAFLVSTSIILWDR